MATISVSRTMSLESIPQQIAASAPSSPKRISDTSPGCHITASSHHELHRAHEGVNFPAPENVSGQRRMQSRPPARLQEKIRRCDHADHRYHDPIATSIYATDDMPASRRVKMTKIAMIVSAQFRASPCREKSGAAHSPAFETGSLDSIGKTELQMSSTRAVCYSAPPADPAA